MRIGFHIPFSGSLKRLQERVTRSRGNTFQLFARGLRGGSLPTINAKQQKAYEQFIEEKHITPLFIHAPYTYNLCEPNEELFQQLQEDLQFAKKMGANYYVIQPGYAKKLHPFIALGHAKETLTRLLDETDWEGTILIRNMCGAGSEVGASWEEYNEMISFHSRIQGALDVSRMYGYGIDITEEEFVEEFEDRIGWEKIHVLYINDYERSLGDKKNYYVPLGEGTIGFGGYEKFLSYSMIQEKPWIIENQPTLEHMDRSIRYTTEFFKKER